MKFDRPFWRPSTAIHGAEGDGNGATTADPGWVPLLVDPAYPEYPSGHACLTGATANGLAHVFGAEAIGFEVSSLVTGTTRTSATAEELHRDAMDGRVWLGIHFRRAMIDGDQLGRDISDWAHERWFEPVGAGCT